MDDDTKITNLNAWLLDFVNNAWDGVKVGESLVSAQEQSSGSADVHTACGLVGPCAKKRGMHNALLSDFGPQVIKSVGQFEPVAKRIRGHAKSANGRQNCVGLANILQVNGYELRIDTLNCGLFFGRINFRVERRQ